MLLSAPFWALAYLAPIELLPGLPISALGTFNPGLAALALSLWADGAAGARRLLSRIFDFGRIKNAGWWSVSLLAFPFIALLSYFILQTRAYDPALTPLDWKIAVLFLVFLIFAFGEELGWAGYATEPLIARFGFLKASLILGTVWAIWHYIPLLQVHRSWDWIAWWSLITIGSRIIMVWLYTRGGKSVASNALFHAMINLSWQYFPLNGSRYDPHIFGLVTSAVVIGVLVFDKTSASHKRILPA